MVKYLEDKKALYLKDVVVYWAQVHTPTFVYGSQTEKEYQVSVIINEEDMKALKKLRLNKQFKEIGVDIPEDKYPGLEGKYLIKITQKAVSSTGKELKIDVLDKNGDPLRDNIGNGSLVNLKLFAMEGVGVSKNKLNIRLNTLLVTKLVEYSSGGSFDDELGIVKGSSNDSEDDADNEFFGKRQGRNTDHDFDDDVPF
jgi:hypothetical protein